MYILCGSEGCDSGAVKWSPEIVSRSAKWCKTEVQDGGMKRRVLEVRDRVKTEQSKTMRQDKLESEFWGKTSLFFGVDTKVLNTNDK